MKHFFIRIVLLVMGIAISGSMVGCNRKETEIDAQFMLESLLTEVTYETEHFHHSGKHARGAGRFSLFG